MSSVKKRFIIKISRDYPELALAEFEELFSVKLEPFGSFQGFFYFEDEEELINDSFYSRLKRLGLTKKVYLILQSFEASSFDSSIDYFNKTLIKSNFKISSCLVEKNSFDCNGKLLADKLFLSGGLDSLVVNLADPEFSYSVFYLKKGDGFEVFFCEEVFSNKDSGFFRRSHLRKWNHPTGSDPRISKAMINLSSKKSFFDPFCGAGGLLIEGGLLGLKVSGCDISKAMVGRALENLSSFELDVKVGVCDALKLEGQFEAIVTDLPFGKNSTTKGLSISELYKKFLFRAKDLTDVLVLGFENESLKEEFFSDYWFVKRRLSYYVHKSMTRTILLLNKK